MKVETGEIEIIVPVPVKVRLSSHMNGPLVELSEVSVDECELELNSLKDAVNDYINDDVEGGANPMLAKKLEIEFDDAFHRIAEDEEYYYKLNSKVDVYA